MYCPSRVQNENSIKFLHFCSICDCPDDLWTGPFCNIRNMNEFKHKCADGTFSAVCDPQCMNGGICIGPDACDCSGTGYVGQYCEIRKFILIF